MEMKQKNAANCGGTFVEAPYTRSNKSCLFNNSHIRTLEALKIEIRELTMIVCYYVN